DLAGLDHHGVARGDGRGRLPGELEKRVVPRRDHAADAHGFVHDLALDAVGGGDDASGVLVGLTSVVTEDAGDVVDVDPALPVGLAGVEGLHDGDLVPVALEQVGDAVQDAPALVGGGAAPVASVECAPGGGDGVFCVGACALADDGQH